MCGIVGYIGNRQAKDIIYAGLQQLEYRGYDSVGIAVLDSTVSTVKEVGDTKNLNVSKLPKATIGIGHTRWATHGKPTTQNAHPHTFGDITLVHNGIIENYQELKTKINQSKLKSETDSEVLAALIDNNYKQTNNLLEAVQLSLSEVKGTFGIAVIAPKNSQIITARRGSPIVIGIDEKQYYIASDQSALIDHTDKVVYLEDDQIVAITNDSLDIYDLRLRQQSTDITQIDNLNSNTSLGKYKSYLEKEIFEQPESIKNVIRGRVGSDGSIVLGGPNLSQKDIESISQIVIIGCGTSFFAGLYAKYKLEELLEIPVAVEYASEFRYRHGAYKKDQTLAIFMSQSGETADVLASLQEAKRRGLKTLGIVNVVGSTLAREVEHGGIYLHAGVEKSVASTKAYSSMVAALLMLGGFFASKLGKNQTITRALAKELVNLPDEIESTLLLHSQIKKISQELVDFHDWFFLGRNDLFPVAMEGALKIAEVSYVHASGFAAGEMKHGQIALVDKNHVSVLLLPEDELLYEKCISALQEIKARDGKALTISTRPKPKLSDFHINISHIGQYTDGLVYNVCLQLLALETAYNKKRNVDKPRNLAKSVTVE